MCWTDFETVVTVVFFIYIFGIFWRMGEVDSRMREVRSLQVCNIQSVNEEAAIEITSQAKHKILINQLY